MFDNSEFAPGRVLFNNLWNAPALRAAIDGTTLDLHWLTEDLLHVEYAGDVSMSVDWHPSMDTSGAFYIRINENPYGWTPSLEKRCREPEVLRQVVLEMAQIAAAKGAAK